jgi:hypothetical protein
MRAKIQQIMDVDQHVPLDGFVQPGPLDLAWLKDHVAVRMSST